MLSFNFLFYLLCAEFSELIEFYHIIQVPFIINLHMIYLFASLSSLLEVSF